MKFLHGRSRADKRAAVHWNCLDPIACLPTKNRYLHQFVEITHYPLPITHYLLPVLQVPLYEFLTMKLKYFFNYSISLIATIVLLEVVCLVFFKSLSGKPFEYNTLEYQRSARIAAILEKIKNYDESQELHMFHPYVGYVARPSIYTGGKTKANEYGVHSAAGYPYPYKKQPNDFVVAVVGGSVAAGFTKFGETFLKKYLHDHGFNKNVVLINLARGGYKQPQPLFYLQYALLSGFEFDAVLNIDGFNDLVLAAKNIDNHINPIFPSGFHTGFLSKMLTSQKFDPHTVEQLSNYYSLYSNELRLLSFIQKPPFKYSVFLNLLGELWTQRNLVRIKQLEFDLANESQRTMTEEFRGPQFKQQGNKYEIVAKIWQQASKMLYAICKANNLVYIHVLQPNQYVKGSKPLSENEKKSAVAPNHPWGIAAREGYSYLVSTGNKLKNQGIPFYDLTMIFKESTEDIYVDVCCHFEHKGNAIMAKKIAEIVMYEVGKQALF